jgi:hypothetical protein
MREWSNCLNDYGSDGGSALRPHVDPTYDGIAGKAGQAYPDDKSSVPLHAMSRLPFAVSFARVSLITRLISLIMKALSRQSLNEAIMRSDIRQQ